MSRRLALWVAAATVMVSSRFAFAQGQGEVTIGYQGLPYKPSGESQNGIQVSEGVLMHVGAGAEAGYDTNVFYAESPNQVGSPIYRASLFASIGNGTRTGATGRIAFEARAGVTYRRYESDQVQDVNGNDYKNAWMPTAGLALNSGTGQFGFGLADTFARIEDAPYASGLPLIIRDNNQASAEMRWAPGGGRLTATARYTNMVDIFEGSYQDASSDTNQLMLDGAWKWLPKTAIFLNVVQGYVFYLESGTNKVSSFPLRITTGLRGLLTEKTSAVLSLGYANGFYSSGATTNGFLGSSYAELAFTIRPTLLSRIVAGYRHDFTNAVIANFTYDETVYASYVQQIAGRLALDLSGRYIHRTYEGFVLSPTDTTGSARTDNYWQVGATLDYFMRNWVYVGFGYSLLANDATITPSASSMTPAPDADYVKQQMFVRLGLTY